MPSSTLQARIKAFEALGTGASKDVLDSVAIRSEPEHLLDRPHSPSAASIPPILPTAYSPSASPGSLGHRSSLIDLKDWVIDDGLFYPSPPSTALGGYSPLQTAKLLPHGSTPLISFDGSPPTVAKGPPLPPRKPSFNSSRSVSAPVASSTVTAASNVRKHPETDHSHLPTLTKLSTCDSIRRNQGHAPVSSVSSFHSVSLSSDGGDSAAAGAPHAPPMERDWTGTGTEDGESLDESFEDVSAPSVFLPPITLPPRPPKPPGALALVTATKQSPAQPPKLPQRPPSQPRGPASGLASHGPSPPPSSITPGAISPAPMLTPSTSGSSVSHTSTRRLPPPPPPITSAPPPRSRPPSARTSVQSTATTASDRSSLVSQATTTSRTSLSSRTSFSPPTSGPGAKQVPRARYDTLFIANVRAHAPKPPPPAPPTKRQNAGWRGLSVDMEPNAYSAPTPAPEPGSDAKLDGRLVCKIWLKSRLEPRRLRDIWNECDPEGTGSLDRDAFARGMARIDEDLRRAQVLGRARAGSPTSLRTPRPGGPSRPILR
ncbi:hypothetical protein BJV78DRAFT_1285154 [Lactifluus subvellereus]|nr:hypothetical protein BJV78DRAFT_1285154 [Lactifluus subvellereus]